MNPPRFRRSAPPRLGLVPLPALFLLTAMGIGGCASGGGSAAGPVPSAGGGALPAQLSLSPPSPDPRIGLGAGLFDAEEAVWNLRLLSSVPPAPDFVGATNSDLAFLGDHVFQGNYNGFMVWNISDPTRPTLTREFLCPASQSDISVYRHLIFVSGEGLGGRLDCGTEGVPEAVSGDRLRGIRIFDGSDIRNPRYVANVQTCRGSHTHTVLEHPGDPDHVYIYVSGSAPVRPAEELPGCTAASPEEDEETALFRIEVIRVPLADPSRAEIVSSPRIFEGLVAPAVHGLAPDDIAELEEARARGAFIIEVMGQQMVLPDPTADQFLAQIVQRRGGSGAPTAADSTTLRDALPAMIAEMVGGGRGGEGDGPEPGPTQCHDITVYPSIGLAGGACEGYGLLLDIRDPVHPVRIDAVADSNFAYWHSATFSNDGSKVLFTDEWGGGGQPKCRASDPMEWGANAIFTIRDRKMDFRSYFKLPAAQTSEENCVAHNGSLIPIPGRDVMVQAWYQGGITVFDWTDPDNPFEIAFHDRGPVDAGTMVMGGSWSAYWYNGVIVSSEIARGLDLFELVPSGHLSRNEIDAARTARLEYLNPQGQPRFEWPASYVLSRAYLDQLERNRGLPVERIAAAREALATAERTGGTTARAALLSLAEELSSATAGAGDRDRIGLLVESLRELAATAEE